MLSVSFGFLGPPLLTFKTDRLDLRGLVLGKSDVIHLYGVFSRDVMAAMLVYLNNGTTAMLMCPTNPPGIELYDNANVFFCSGEKNKVTDPVNENTL